MSGGTTILCTIFTLLLTFLGKSCNAHMRHASGVYYSDMVSGPNFGTKIPVFRANSGCLFGTKWRKWWNYKNVSRIVKIVHSVTT